MNIFLTGATGFIGSNLLPKLLYLNHKVCAVCHSSFKYDYAHPNLHWLHGSLDSNFSDYLRNIDFVIHLASYGVTNGGNNWLKCFDINVSQFLRLILSAVEVGVKRFIVVGSCFEYGRAGEIYSSIPVDSVLLPTTAYSASKCAATSLAYALAVQHKLKMIIVRPFHIYGNGEHKDRFYPSIVEAAKSGNNFPMTQGEQVRDFQNVDDTTDELIKLLENNALKDGYPLLVNLGSGKPTKLIDFAKSQWSQLNASGTIRPGEIPYRDNEVMNYTPIVESCDFSQSHHSP